MKISEGFKLGLGFYIGYTVGSVLDKVLGELYKNNK